MRLYNQTRQAYYEIYDITYDLKGDPQFLIYYDGQWILLDAKHFSPYAPWDKDENCDG